MEHSGQNSSTDLPAGKSSPKRGRPAGTKSAAKKTAVAPPLPGIAGEGRKRVVIANIVPRIDEGAVVAKAAIGEPLLITADVYADGHDTIAAAVLLRHVSDKAWQEIPMQFAGNDKWQLSFTPPRTGLFQFQIIGWVDHFATWQKGLVKKREAGQDIGVELKIGAALIENAAGAAASRDAGQLNKAAAALLAGDPEAAYRAATDEKLALLMYRNRDASLVTTSPQPLSFEAERRKAAYSTWYELFPRSATAEEGRHGTFRDVEKLLPRIASMGFDTLYFPPIHPIGEEKRKGKNNSLTAGVGDPGSPWAIGNRLGGHKAIHPELGTLDDFKSLIRAAEEHEIEIAMDIAYQCAPDHPYVQEHPQWFKWRPDGTVQYAENPPKKYEDILPFNFETDDWQALWNELKSVIDYWIDQGIRVFRIDNPHTKSLQFWQWMIGEVRREAPDVIFLAEAFTRPRIMEQLGKAGFNQSYTYFTWRTEAWEIREYMKELCSDRMRYLYRPNFWPNTPDILPPHLSAGGENAHIQRLILAATLSSNYGLYGPVYEFGINTPHPGKEEYTDNEKYELKHWDWKAETRIGEIIGRVNKIRHQNPALQSTWNIHFAESTNEQILCYGKRDEASGNTLIIAVNLDAFNTQSASVKLPLRQLGIPADAPLKVRDLLSGDSYEWQGEWNYVSLNPWAMPAHILLVESETITPTTLPLQSTGDAH